MGNGLQTVNELSMVFSADCPVMITGGALLTETASGRPVGKVVMKNLSQNTVISCRINAYAFDENDNRLNGVQDFAYNGLSVGHGEEFGAMQLFYLPDNKTQSIVAGITSVVFSNGYEWKPSAATNWQMPSYGDTVENRLGRELAAQYAADVGGNCPFVPELAGGLFLCTCGTPNLAGEPCSKCSRTFEQLISALDPARLNSELAAKKAAQVQPSEPVRQYEPVRQSEPVQQSAPVQQNAPVQQYAPVQQSATVRRQAPKKSKKPLVISIIAGAAALIAAFIAVFVTVIYPTSCYNAANEILTAESVSTDDYYKAYKEFKKLGNFKDSREKSLNAGMNYITSYVEEFHYLATLMDDVWYVYNDLKDSGYADGEELYNFIYGPCIELRYFNDKKDDSDTIAESLPTKTSFAHFSFQFIAGCDFDGTGDKKYDLYHKIFYPGGSTAEDGKDSWHWEDVNSGDSEGLEWGSGWSSRAGTMLIIIYDSSNDREVGRFEMKIS